MGSKNRDRGIQLRFGLTTCSRCSGDRLLARECPECGARPKRHEVQTDLQRRERLVADFRARRLIPDSAAAPDLKRLYPQFDRVVNRVKRALSRAAKEHRDADVLLSAFAELDQLVVSWRQPLLRPERNRGKVLGQALSTFGEGIDLFVDALAAPDMHTAQQLEAAGNRLLGEATAKFERLELFNDADHAFSGATPFENLNQIGLAVRESMGPESSLHELDARLADGTGWGVSAAGMGLQAHVVNLFALSAFDFEQFVQLLTTADAAAGRSGQDLALSDAWKRSHARAAAFLASSTASIGQVMDSSGSSDFEIADRMLVAVAKWRDGVLKHSLATMFATSVEEYERLMRQSGGSLIKKASPAFPKLRLDENLTSELRNAGGHAGVDLRRDCVLIGEVEFSYSEFIDRVLAYLETAMGTFVGVSLAMSKHGSDFDCADYLADRDRDAGIAMFLGSFGLACDSVETDESAVVIRSRGAEPKWMTLAAALSAMLPDRVNTAKLFVATSAGEREFVTSVEHLRRFPAESAQLELHEIALNLAAVASASRLDGDSVWSSDEWATVLRAVLTRDDSLELREWVPNVRRLRDYGRDAGQSQVVDACNAAIAELRRSSQLKTV